MALRDNRYDPPRISRWSIIGLVVGVGVSVAIVVAAVLDGRWFTAVGFTFIGGNLLYQHVQMRRRHDAALAGWRPPPPRA